MWGQRIAANPLARNTDLSGLSGWKIYSYLRKRGKRGKSKAEGEMMIA
jgi:hypothetical protein